MQELTFVALSSDGDTLMMVAPDGSEFCLPADDKIRKALGSSPPGRRRRPRTCRCGYH